MSLNTHRCTSGVGAVRFEMCMLQCRRLLYNQTCEKDWIHIMYSGADVVLNCQAGREESGKRYGRGMGAGCLGAKS